MMKKLLSVLVLSLTLNAFADNITETVEKEGVNSIHPAHKEAYPYFARQNRHRILYLFMTILGTSLISS